MAVFTYKSKIEDVIFPYNTYEDLFLGNRTRRFADYSGDDDIGGHIRLSGSKLDYELDTLTAGTITQIDFFDEKGRIDATIKNTKIDVTELSSVEPLSIDSLISLALAGKDTVHGSKADDFLLGGGGNDLLRGGGGDDNMTGDAGNDTYIGGKGSDIFLSGFMSGHDVVKDFDAKGGPGKQDFIALGLEVEPTFSPQGKHTLISFGDFGSILLQNVKFDDFNAADIVDWPL